MAKAPKFNRPQTYDRTECMLDRCAYLAAGACYREGRCRERFALRSESPIGFNVALFDSDLVVSGAYEPDVLPGKCETRVVTVMMARPKIVNPRRVDRSVADQWLRVAGQEAISHAGVCTPHGCSCPNCREYQEVRSRAIAIFDRGTVSELSEAYIIAMGEVTGGAASTVWDRPRGVAEPRLPADLAGRPAKIIVTSNPEGRDNNWVKDRFGGLEL